MNIYLLNIFTFLGDSLILYSSSSSSHLSESLAVLY
jgi:hypothetical protein